MKRFTETTKWTDAWYRKLPPRLKCLWQHLVDHCDAAGVIDPDWELASFQIGENVSPADLVEFGERIRKLDSGKLWIVKFIHFQYQNLSESCPAHKPVFAKIKEHRINRLLKGYPKAKHSLQEKEKDKTRNRKGIDADATPPEPAPVSEFEQFWNAYPRKVGKRAAQAKWDTLKPSLEQCLHAIEHQKISEQWRRDGGQFIPHPTTWLNQGRWDDAPKVELGRKKPAAQSVPVPDPDGWAVWLKENYPTASGQPYCVAPPEVQAEFKKSQQQNS